MGAGRGRDWAGRIGRRLRRGNLRTDPGLCGQLGEYLQLLLRWNEKINLTSLSEPEDLVERLIVEPVAAAMHWPEGGSRMLDVGSGGGSPAIPMKLVLPAVELWMIEAKTRKAAFLREAVRTLGIERAHVEMRRYEELLSRPDLHEAMDVVTLRAVRAEAKLLGALQGLLKPGGLLFWFRGPGGQDLPPALTPLYGLRASHGLVGRLRSRLVILEKIQVPHRQFQGLA